MFAKIFMKEWRENILIFTLAILMMVALIVLNLTGQKDMTLYTSGMFLLLFLPFAALLIGSGGFYSEYKDNAWIYLFSRPIRKEILWISKFVSQLSILLVIFLIFYFVRRFLPGLDKILQDLDYPDAYGELFSISVYIVMPLMAFTIAFSLSLLHDKQFIIFFVTILIGAGLIFATQQYIFFLWLRGFYVKNEGIFSLFFALSFVLASLLTLLKSDFSQVRNKIFRFSKYLLIFLVISFFISTVVATRGQIFSPRRNFSIWNYQRFQDSLYFQDWRKGILRYDPDQEKIERLNKDSRFSSESFSLRADKIAYHQILSRRQWTQDLWVMNADGSDARPLVESSAEESPFYRKRVESFLLSSDAKKIAFVTTHWEDIEGERNARIHTLWWMNTDKSQLKSHRFDLPSSTRLQLIAWPPDQDTIVMLIGERPPRHAEPPDIITFNLTEGSQRVLIEELKPPRRWNVSPDQNYLTLRMRSFEQNKETLSLLDLCTHEKFEVFSAEHLRLWARKWSPDGRKIAISRGNELWIYNLEEKKLEKISQRNYEYEIGFDWTSDGQKFILLAPIDGENRLVVMDKHFQEERTIKIPIKLKGTISIWGLENRALLKGNRKGALWRVDLETEDWKKVY